VLLVGLTLGLAAAAAAATGTADASHPCRPGVRAPIQLGSRTIPPPPADRPAVTDALRLTAHAARPRHVILRLDGPADAARREALAAHGIELQGQLDGGAWIARMPPDLDGDPLDELPIADIGTLEPAAKLAPSLADGEPPRHALVATRAADRAPIDGPRRDDDPSTVPAAEAGYAVAVYVEMHRDVALDPALARLERASGARVLGRLHSLGGALLLVEPGAWMRIAADEDVKWIEPASPALGTLADGLRASLGVDALRAAVSDLDGSGVGVVLYDGGVLCETQPDLGGRVVLGEEGPVSTHATHVAGILGGSGGASDGRYRGVAPGVEVLSYYYESCRPLCLYGNPQDLEEDYAEAIALHDADFASNSLGSNIAMNGYACDLEGDYEVTARLVDAIAAGSLGRPFASFWAIGNERQGDARCGDGYGTTGIPATAKNGIVVGSIDSDTGLVSDFSSFGPTDDGRLRPDVVAPGCEVGDDHGITSTRSCVGHTVLCGTSMATPAVAGVAALVLERLGQVRAGELEPLPSTYKAILGITATDLGRPGPDYIYGYGLVDAERAVALVDAAVLLEASLVQGAVNTLTFDVPADLDTLRAMLAWDDPPGQPLSARNLVNDLDLVLRAPDGAVHAPFVLDPASPDTPATRGVNRRDPSELVEVVSPVAGRWTVEVRGTSVPIGPQSYTLAMTVPAAAVSSGITANGKTPAAPARAWLAQNAPNPFKPWTAIRFGTEFAGERLELGVYDAGGRHVCTLYTGRPGSGTQVAYWDGRDGRGRRVASGIYFCELTHAAGREVRRMVVLR
jgi:subtilisin family serine protease